MHSRLPALDLRKLARHRALQSLRSPGNNRPECWFAELNRVPFRQRERDRADGDKQQQTKRASEEMRFDVGIGLFFHDAGVLS